MDATLVILISFLYLTLMFGIAIYGNKKAKEGRSVVNNPFTYSLSLAVYCTVWTYYGSVGRAADTGLSYATVYLGPTLFAPLWYLLMRKILLISKQFRITSIADFISARYGKSSWLGIISTVIIVVGVIPYISIQLKAIGFSFELLTKSSIDHEFWNATTFYQDKVNYFTILLAVFTILFGTRSLDPNERHEGMMAAIAFESIVKLIAFIATGLFVVYGLFNGFGDLFRQALDYPETTQILTLDTSPIAKTNWFWVMILSAVAAMFLPRQFHVIVVENNDVSFLRKASWMFPLYLLLISFFVLPIALAGKLLLPTTLEPDSYILSLPLFFNHGWLAMLVYIGGFSAAAGMVVVSVIALSIMVSNNLLLPFLLKTKPATQAEKFTLMADRLLNLRRLVIIVIMFLAYGFYKSVSSNFPLVSIGLMSFTAILQLMPAIIGGLFWNRGNKKGAISGLILGFIIWMITLPIPAMAESGVLSPTLLTDGYGSIALFKPYALFGLENVDSITNACTWSMVFNIGAYVIVSLFTSQHVDELASADYFVNIDKYANSPELEVIRREASIVKLKQLLVHYFGNEKTRAYLSNYNGSYKDFKGIDDAASQEFINYVEKVLTGAFGAASAKILMSTHIRNQPISTGQLNELITQTRDILVYSKALEVKTDELQKTSAALAIVNEQLKELDVLKAEFISTVTHELRTPITTIRSFAQTLSTKDQLDIQTQKEFLHIIVKECDRINRLIKQVLEVERLDSPLGQVSGQAPLNASIQEAVLRLEPLIQEKNIQLNQKYCRENTVALEGDEVLQIALNLLSNAIKFCDAKEGKIWIEVKEMPSENATHCTIGNNGIPIPNQALSTLFEKFTQVKSGHLAKPEGSGLGLYITKKIVQKTGGSIHCTSDLKHGTQFTIVFPWT